MIIVYHYMPAIDMHVKFLKTVGDGEAFCYSVGKSELNISQVLTCKGSVVTILYQCCTETVLTGIQITMGLSLSSMPVWSREDASKSIILCVGRRHMSIDYGPICFFFF